MENENVTQTIQENTTVQQPEQTMQEKVDQAIPEGKVENWATKELEEINEKRASYGNYLKMVPDKLYSLVINFKPTEPFNSKTFDDGKTVREIPVLWDEFPEKKDVDMVEMIWSLNPMNPTYSELLELLMNNKRVFKIMRTGEGKATVYTIVKD